LLEQLVQVLLAAADPHVEDVANADGEEAGLHLPGGGAGEEGLAAPRRAVHEDAAADLFAVGLEQLGLLQRQDDLHADFVFDGVHAADLIEVDRGTFDFSFFTTRRQFASGFAESPFVVLLVERVGRRAIDAELAGEFSVGGFGVDLDGFAILVGGTLGFAGAKEELGVQHVRGGGRVALLDEVFDDHQSGGVLLLLVEGVGEADFQIDVVRDDGEAGSIGGFGVLEPTEL
jgi:hypothetical protein